MDEKDTSRLEAFSDGVFGVAITLLILNVNFDLKGPNDKFWSDGVLWQKILAQWPQLFAFVTSFLTIGVMWLNHHRIFRLVRRSNTILLLINLFLLMLIVFVPVPTALLADYLRHSEFRTPALIYTGTYVLMAMLFNVLWRYASYHGRLLGQGTDLQAARKISEQYMYGPAFYLIAFALAWFNTIVCVIFCFALAIFFAFPEHPLHMITRKRDPVSTDMDTRISDG
jgi:uncharacterized membrane protein